MSLNKVNYIDNSTIITAKNLNDIQDNIIGLQDNIIELQDNLENIKIKPKAGFIYPLASSVVPEGFLLCNGTAYLRTEYPELFAAIGTMYGEGDGSTTFNVPNLQTRVPVGKGEGYELGDIGGEATHKLTTGEMPIHHHNAYVNGFEYESSIVGAPAYYGTLNSGTYTYSYHTQDTAKAIAFVNQAGKDQPHNNMQPYTVVNYIIATGKNTGVSVADIVAGAQALPLDVEYGGTGANNIQDIHKNLQIRASATNLLDNSDFRNPVNQRNVTSFTDGYGIDRWMSSGTTTVSGSGITVNNICQQYLETGAVKNCIHTLAAMKADGTVICYSQNPLDAFEENSDASLGLGFYDIENVVIARLYAGEYLWVALYEGEYTAETLPTYQSKGYGAELLECRRYFISENISIINSMPGGGLRVFFPYTQRMRVTPTVVSTGTVYDNNATQQSVNFNWLSEKETGILLAFSWSSGSFTYGYSFISNINITLNADLGGMKNG